MKVSVVTALGPNRRYFQQARESIFKQTFQDFEWLIEEGAGLANARNQGFRRAKGEYVAIMDADDISLPRRLATEVAYLDSHPEVSVIGTWGYRMGTRAGVCEPPEDVSLRALFMWDRIIHTSAMMRKEDVMPFGPYRDVMFEDWDLWIRLVKAGKVIRNIPEPLVGFRFSKEGHSSSISRASWYGNQVRQRLSCFAS